MPYAQGAVKAACPNLEALDFTTEPRDGRRFAPAPSPAVGLFREVLHSRHLNKGTTWRPNDLTDMIYLSCAAGYADYRRLTDAVAAIEKAREASDVPADPAQQRWIALHLGASAHASLTHQPVTTEHPS